ncbi:MAG: HAD family hydrolase [Pseudonocardia sp.]
MTESRSKLSDLLDGVDALLFDFDGPLCDVFAGLLAPDVARELERLAGREFETDDPLEVVRLCYDNLSPAVARRVEDALIEFEIKAVSMSTTEAAGVRALRNGRAAGLDIAVVTNNATQAAEAFLVDQSVRPLVSIVVGRAFRRPDLMKPHPWPLRRALDELGVAARRAVLIGDSRTDIEASRATGVRCVAFANRPGKREEFEAAGAAVVVDDMGELADVLEQDDIRRTGLA